MWKELAVCCWLDMVVYCMLQLGFVRLRREESARVSSESGEARKPKFQITIHVFYYLRTRIVLCTVRELIICPGDKTRTLYCNLKPSLTTQKGLALFFIIRKLKWEGIYSTNILEEGKQDDRKGEQLFYN